MPILRGGIEKSVKVSVVVAVGKVILALAVSFGAGILLSDFYLTTVLLASIASIFVLGALYEVARGRGSKRFEDEVRNFPVWLTLEDADAPVTRGGRLRGIVPKELARISLATFVLVCWGYPLRVAAGFFSVSPCLLRQLAEMGDASTICAFVFTLLASAFFGESFVTITWALEAADLKRRIDDNEFGSDGKPRQFYKPHIACMGYALGSALRKDHPLREHTPLSRPWNSCMLLSVMLMTIAVILVGFRSSILLAVCAGLLISVLLFLPFFVYGQGLHCPSASKNVFSNFAGFGCGASCCIGCSGAYSRARLASSLRLDRLFSRKRRACRCAYLGHCILSSDLLRISTLEL